MNRVKIFQNKNFPEKKKLRIVFVREEEAKNSRIFFRVEFFSEKKKLRQFAQSRIFFREEEAKNSICPE